MKRREIINKLLLATPIIAFGAGCSFKGKTLGSENPKNINELENLLASGKVAAADIPKVMNNAAKLIGFEIIPDTTITDIRYAQNGERIFLHVVSVVKGLEKIKPKDALVDGGGEVPYRLEFIHGYKDWESGFYWTSYSMNERDFKESLRRHNGQQSGVSNSNDPNTVRHVYTSRGEKVSETLASYTYVWDEDNTANAKMIDVSVKFMDITDPDKEPEHDYEKKRVCQTCSNGTTTHDWK